MIITLYRENQPNFGIRIKQIENPKTGAIGLYICHIQENSVAHKVNVNFKSGWTIGSWRSICKRKWNFYDWYYRKSVMINFI